MELWVSAGEEFDSSVTETSWSNKPHTINIKLIILGHYKAVSTAKDSNYGNNNLSEVFDQTPLSETVQVQSQSGCI